VETTGTVLGFHEIVDVGVVRTGPDARDVFGRWSQRIRPRWPERISPGAIELNKYSATAWQDAAVDSPEFWQHFNEFVEGAVPVCHNPSFDRGFITIAAMQQGVTQLAMDYHWIGTESLAWPLVVSGRLSRLSLESLCRFFNLEPEGLPHTALTGAEACRLVYIGLIEGCRRGSWIP
jgi:DNA polymerase III alpha subunit (gram-positive type)